MISNFKQVLLFYFISFAICWTNGSNKVGDEILCHDEKSQHDAMVKRLHELEREIRMFRQNEQPQKSPPNVLEVKCANNRLPRNCNEIDECQIYLYRVAIAGSSFAVSCDVKTEDTTWTVIQRRQDGSVNFFTHWRHYARGFGDLDGEFFIGLDKLHALTTQGADQQLYVIVEDFEGVRKYAKYNTFRVDSADNRYTLTVGNYSGNAGDSLSYHSGYNFSTWDRNNGNMCARKKKGGWWYNNCFESNLNGKYLRGKLGDTGDGITWAGFRGYRYSLKFTQMMIRRREN